MELPLKPMPHTRMMIPLLLLLPIVHHVFASDTRVEHYIREYAWNAELVRSVHTAYEVVYPFQSRDRTRIGLSTRDYFYDVQTHFPEATFVIRSSGGRLKLNLKRVDSLFVDKTVFNRINKDGVSERVKTSPENCYYQGTVHNEPDSLVAISTCSGLRGVIFSANETYRIIPLKGGDLGRRHPHLLMKCEWNKDMLCANTAHTQWSNHAASKRTSRVKRDSETAQKTVELALIADYAMARDWDYEYQPLVRHVLEAVNVIDLIYKRELNTGVCLVYFEAWLGNNHMTIHSDITQTTLNLIDYLSHSIHSHNKDMTVFMTKHRFGKREQLMAATGSVCTARAAAISTVGSVFEVEQTALSLAHSVGHILGMEHDTRSCKCDNRRGCIMSQRVGEKQKELTRSFSSCSIEDYLNTLRIGGGRCLFNEPFKESSLSQCGNRFVDPGEQCDCGSIEECDSIDPCCDPVTCKLKAFAQCAKGQCCDKCKLKAGGTLCREARSACDVPEHCDGVSGQCPVDASMVNGSPCQGGKGVCHQRMCATNDQQCTSIWGQGARGAEKECFQRFNVLGIDHGNCGFDQVTHRPRPCDLHNAQCGLLHCRAGSDIPLLSDFDGTHLKTEFFEGSKSFECKVVAGQRLGMVSDGSRCGKEGICRGGACVPISDVAVTPTCPTNNVALTCSGHGVCTTENWCFCDAGFAGEDCGKVVPTEAPVYRPDYEYRSNASAPSAPRIVNSADVYATPKLDTSSMLIILGSVAGFIVILLLFMLFCYRRRTSSSLSDKKLNGAIGKDVDGFSESSMDTAQRSIKFGNMPSYRDEKRWRRKQRHHLHKIHEVSDERDSVSNKSSAVGSNASAPTVVNLNHINHHQSPTVDDNFSFGPIRYGPEKGILKNSDGSTTPLLPRPTGLSVRSPDEVGYESEPPCSLKVFEQSLRHLERYSPYHVPYIYDSQANQHTSPQSECWGGSNSRNRSAKGHPGQFHPRPMQMTVFSPQSTPRSITVSAARGGYATDTEVGYTRKRGRTWSHASSHDQSPPSACNAAAGHSATKLSPSNSVASSSSRGFLGRPAPLKLRNIEYLLKQLDTGNEDDNSDAICAHSPGQSCSSAEMSVPEADKHDQVDEGSNTESSRDALSSIVNNMHMCQQIPVLHTFSNGINSADSSGCMLETYDNSTVLSFDSTPPKDHYQTHT